jgi:hypothetical protein
MDCAETETLLIDYHFALGPGAQLEAVHAHLRRCIRCAQSYLDLKHAVDSGAALEAAPSPARRARLRAEVGAMFQPSRLARARQWLTRPVPRYQAAAAAALVGVLQLTAAGAVLGLRDRSEPVLAREAGSRGRGDPVLRHTFESVDSARPMAVSLTYY